MRDGKVAKGALMKNKEFDYDKTIKAGDIVTSYEDGYFRVTKVERRFYTKDDEDSFDFLEKKYGVRPKIGDEMNPTIHSELLVTDDFEIEEGMDECDATFCERVNKRLTKKILKIIGEA